MPREKASRFSVLNDLQELSKESDRLSELIPPTTALSDYLALWKATVLKIKTCTSVKDIEYPPDIRTVISGEQKVIKTVQDEIAETDRAHVHAEKNVVTGNKTSDTTVKKNQRNSEVKKSKDKDSVLGVGIPISIAGKSEAVSLSDVSCKKINQERPLPDTSLPKTETANFTIKTVPQNNTDTSQKLLKTPIMNTTFNGLINNTIVSQNNTDMSQKLMETPIMNTTFNRLINNTVVYDSASSCDGDLRITRSGSKQVLKNNTVVLDSASSCDGDLRITRSGSKQVLKNCRTSNSRLLTRSGSKRKSSPSKNVETSKKLKEEISSSSVSVTATKATRSKKPLKKNLKTNENTSKTSAVIVPTMKHKTVVISKEKQIREEIQRREEKANENRKKVLAERQLKAEEKKKKRNDKMEKTLQKRLMMEKEKEERLEKKENDIKKTHVNSFKESVKNPVLKLRTKEVVDQHLKENNSMNSSTPKQNGTNGGTVFKTPARNISPRESETYELTPVPDSSTYDFSDDDDQGKNAGKPIPSWAQGIQLRLALTHQYFNPPDSNAIFGSYIETPNLTEIFRVQKKQYLKRTSSAVWKTPPDRSYL